MNKKTEQKSFYKQAKALLCLPPNYCYTYDFPPLGTPLLTGFLKEHGIEAIQADYNMDYLDYWREQIIPEKVNSKTSTQEAAIWVRALLNELYQAKRLAGLYYSSLLPSDSQPSTYSDLTNSSFGFTEKALSSDILERYLNDEKENTFLRYYLDRKILDFIVENKINFVGMSVIAPSQSLAAFTL
jgi:hypothetical protein